MKFYWYVAVLAITVLLAIAFAIVPGKADNIYPYSIEKGDNIISYIKNSTADVELFEYGPDKNSWRVNFDRQRGQFNFIGICNYPNGTLEEINQMAKEKIYAPRFASNSTEPYVKGLEIHSGHFDANGNETFIPFHYLVYPDGKTVKIFTQPLLKDGDKWKINQVPWAMGNWEKNCQTIAIAALGDGNMTLLQADTVNVLISSLKRENPHALVSRHT